MKTADTPTEVTLNYWIKATESAEIARIYVKDMSGSELGFFERKTLKADRKADGYYNTHRIAKGDCTTYDEQPITFTGCEDVKEALYAIVEAEVAANRAAYVAAIEANIAAVEVPAESKHTCGGRSTGLRDGCLACVRKYALALLETLNQNLAIAHANGAATADEYEVWKGLCERARGFNYAAYGHNAKVIKKENAARSKATVKL